MIEIDKEITKRKLKSRMILQVHDELLFHVPFNEKEELIKLAKDKMENAMTLLVPLFVGCGVGKNWDEAH